MEMHMSRFIRKQIKILGKIIKLIFVYMVDNFCFEKIAPKMFFCYKNLLRYITIFHSSMMVGLKDMFISSCGNGVALKVPRGFIGFFAFNGWPMTFFKRARVWLNNTFGSCTPSRFSFFGKTITGMRTIFFNPIIFCSTRKFITTLFTDKCFHVNSVT